jgi:hypothetical protein
MNTYWKRAVLGCAALCALLSTSIMLVTPASAYERWLRVHNDTSYTIEHIYVRCRDCENWSRDLLGAYSINAGDWGQIDPGWSMGYCMFNVKVEFDDNTVTRDYLNLCEMQDWTIYE